MGLLSGLLGNASEADADKLEQDLADILAEGESIDSAYRIFRDVWVFTNRRLILIDKQGVTGRKVEYLSVPYKSVVLFSVESAGTFDMESELNIWISGRPEPLQKTFGRGGDVIKVQKTLAKFVLK